MQSKRLGRLVYRNGGDDEGVGRARRATTSTSMMMLITTTAAAMNLHLRGGKGVATMG
jgi:hypothetical protein